MAHPKLHIQIITTILLITLQATSSASIKPNARPVYEVNEQIRIDDKPKVASNPGILPYGNPLAGNSKQNARLHASNQQAMFNAERIRQHKAQLQRWTKGPQIIDSYMKAYHELQENHQLEVEEQQATLKDNPVTPAVTTRGRPNRQRGQNKRIQNNNDNLPKTLHNEPTVTSKRSQNQRKELPRRGSSIQRSESTKVTKADAVIKSTRSRNHRSYGSADYHQNLEPIRYKTIYVSPEPSYGQGVTIKPNGNNGLNKFQANIPSKLYTEAIPSEPTPTYPKQYSQQQFNSVQEIEALNSLLSKNPTEQLSKFNALLNAEKDTDDTVEEEPIDFYFYLKDPTRTVSQNFDATKYDSAYITSNPNKDYIPITEDTDEIQDPTKSKRPITFSQPTASTTASKLETVTTKSNNYYKVEVASQVISDESKNSQINYLNNNVDSHRAVNYGYQPYFNKEIDASTSERYLHNNAQPTGVQHLSGDGTETSAYGDDNLKYAANYEFGYRVKDEDSGNYFGHREAKKGENTKGQYHVLLPDGRVQQVSYSAGPEGFHADITYDHLQ